MRSSIVAALITIVVGRAGADVDVAGSRADELDPRPDAVGRDIAVEASFGRCALPLQDWDRSPSATCLACHGGGGSRDLGSSHPVDVDYASAQARSAASLRPVAAVVARGVFLPEGRVQCTSCHDARSPWAYHLALPAGAAARPAVDPRKPETYLGRPNWRMPASASERPPPNGTAVTPAQLCAACHALD